MALGVLHCPFGKSFCRCQSFSIQYLGHVGALKVVFTFQLSDSNNTLFSTTLDTNLVSYLLNQF